MSLSRYEQETSIWYNNEDDMAICYTCNKALMNKLDKYCANYPDTYNFKRDIVYDGIVVGKEYIFPKKLVSFRSPSTKSISDEQRQVLSERMKTLRKQKK